MGTVPADVITGFFGDPVTSVKEIKTGLVNNTYCVEASSRKYILQRLNPVFDRRLIDDMQVCGRYLEEAGWEAPAVVPTQAGSNAFVDEAGDLWRCLSFIESDGSGLPVLGDDGLQAVGSLLARWHQTMAGLPYRPRYAIPHFHDTAWHAAALQKNMPKLKDKAHRLMAADVLVAYHTLPALAALPDQLLHGDPQLNNILFRDGQPFTFIDLDTLMFGPIWYDIGDLLRSMLEADILAGRTLSTNMLQHVILGYFDRPEADALRATQLIALELAMRFLNDIVDDTYFAWDSGRFSSRADNHMYRTGIQWQIYEHIRKEFDT